MEPTTSKKPFIEPEIIKEKATATHPPMEERAFGPVIGIIVIITLLAFGALYFWGAHLQDAVTPTAQQDDAEFYFDDQSAYETFLNNEYTDSDFEIIDTSYEDTVLDHTFDDFTDFETFDKELESFDFDL